MSDPKPSDPKRRGKYRPPGLTREDASDLISGKATDPQKPDCGDEETIKSDVEDAEAAVAGEIRDRFNEAVKVRWKDKDDLSRMDAEGRVDARDARAAYAARSRGGQPGNRNAASREGPFDGQFPLKLPRALRDAAIEAAKGTPDRNLSRMLRRLLREELERIGVK